MKTEFFRYFLDTLKKLNLKDIIIYKDEKNDKINNILRLSLKNKKIKNLSAKEWLDTKSNIAIITTTAYNEENYNLICEKYLKKNFNYILVIYINNKKNLLYDLPQKLNTNMITKFYIKYNNIFGMIIYDKDSWPYKDFFSNIKRKNIINKILLHYNITKDSIFYKSFFWKNFLDFDEYYFRYLNFDHRNLKNILFNINIFYRIVNFLEEHNITYRADAGTLLGAMKWGGYILHDVDFDLVLGKNTIKNLLKNKDFIDYLNTYNLSHDYVYNSKNKCGIVRIKHNVNTSLNIDLYGIIKKQNFYRLCHYEASESDDNKIYNIMVDELESKPSKIKYGEIYLKAYSKEKIKQYLDRTYWGWFDLIYIRDPDYFVKNFNVNFLRSIYFYKKGKINVSFRKNYEKFLTDKELKNLETMYLNK